MVFELKLCKIDDEVGVVLPREVLAHMGVNEGDTIVLTEDADRSVRLNPATAEFKHQMEIVDDLINRYRNTLRALSD